MLLPVFVAKKLSKEVQDNIARKAYSEEELKRIYDALTSNVSDAKNGFAASAVLFLLVFGFIAYKIVSVDSRFTAFGVLFGAACYAMVLLVLYLNMTSAKRQFSRLVKANYQGFDEGMLRQ